LKFTFTKFTRKRIQPETYGMKDMTQLIGLAHQNPVRFDGHERNVTAIATFPDGERTATGSEDKTSGSGNSRTAEN
jgi:WD40 repeat protein